MRSTSLACLVAFVILGCGGNSAPTAFGTGGTSSTGGSQSGGSAGLPGSGGTLGTAGAAGTLSAGGSQTGGQGGTPSTGGAATGGTAGTSGTGGTGGTTGGTGGTTGGTGGTTGGTGGTTGGTGGTGGTVDPFCPDTATASGQFTIRYDAVEIPVTGGGKSYYAHTNWWHLFNGQTMSYNGLSFAIGDPSGTAVATTDGSPTGFPSMFIGSYSGNTTIGSNLPKQVSALTTVPTVFSTNSLSKDTSRFNAAYDVWLTASGNPLPANQFSPGTGGAYLMVWLFKPADERPRGPNLANYTGRTVSGVSGTWDVWVDPARTGSPPCISYVSTTPLDSLSFDLNAFIQDSIQNTYGITSSMYLSVIFAGFEIWAGGDGLEVNRFCARVN
jgi:hypothetical protein